MRILSFLLASLVWSGCAQGPRPAPPDDCTLFADGGCPAPTTCRLVGGGTGRCVIPASMGTSGCVPESCAEHEACVAVEGLLACRPICTLDGLRRCPGEGQCTYPIEGSETFGVCSQPCDLLTDCGVAGTCAPSSTTPYPICVAIGPAELGATCREERCAQGLVCLRVDGDPKCYAVCPRGSDNSCDGQGCRGIIEGANDLGYCTPVPPDSP